MTSQRVDPDSQSMGQSGPYEDQGEARPGTPQPRPEGLNQVRLGAVLARLRLGRGLTQTALALRADIPRTYVNALEAGRHEPTARTLTALARALGMDLAELVWQLAGRAYTDPRATFGERVAQRRLALGYRRQADLAGAAGVPRATLNQVERGGIANPKLSLLSRLATALYCCPSELLRGLDAPNRDSGQGVTREQ